MNPNSAATSAIDPDNEEITEDEKEEEEIIEDQCTQFSDDIFDTLPEEIKKLLVVAKDRKEKDIILLGILTVSSTLFPALWTIYGNKKYSAHIYTYIVAAAGAGKGGAMNGVILAKKTDRELERIYTTEKKEYEKKCIELLLSAKSSYIIIMIGPSSDFGSQPYFGYL